MRRLRWFALWGLAAFVFASCATRKEDPAPPAGDEAAETPSGASDAAGESGAPDEGMPGAADPRMAAEIERAERERSRTEALVAQYVELGDQAAARGEWTEAERFYGQAVELDPTNEAARRKFENAGMGMPGAAREDFQSAEDQRLVRRQQAQVEISNLVNEAERAEQAGEFDRAIQRYQKALLIAGLYPYYGDFSPNEEQLRDLIAGATNRKVEAEAARRAAELREARELREAEERRQAQAREARIQGLFNQANLAMQRAEYQLAGEYAERILQLDPTSESAARLAHLARQAHLARASETAERDIREQWKTTFEQIMESARPQVEPVRFPDTWPQKEGIRKPIAFNEDVLGGEADPRDRHVMNLLETTSVNLDFTDTALQEALAHLAGMTGVNIMLMPTVYAERDESDLVITLQATGLTTKDALDLIALSRDLSWRIDNGVVQVGLPGEAAGPVILDLYDVKDLTVPVRSFPGEDINLTPSGGSLGIGAFDQEEIDPRQIFDGDALADLIRDTIDPDVWGNQGDVNYRPSGSILVVKAPADTHRKVRELLEGLRGTGGITVQIETRFITVEDSFLQDIGVDIRGLGDQSGGIGVGGKGNVETFDDVLAGGVNNPAGIGTANTAGVFYNIAHHGDVRGRAENLLDVALGRSGILTGAGGAAIQATYLDDAQVEMILRAVEKSARSTIVVAPKLTVYNHERANVTILNQVSYIQDFDVEIAQAAQIGDPIVQTLRDGVILDVMPIVSADRKYITLELRPTVAVLQRPIQTFSTTLANGPPVIIHLPELQIQRVRTTVTMPDGGILLLGGMKFFQEERQTSSVPFINKIPILNFFWSRRGTFVSRKNLLILIKAQILILEEMEPRFGGED